MPEVISLNGRWGVGKTFFWSQLIKQLAKDNSLKLQKYAYISLFGIASLDQLKSAVFEQTVQTANIAEGVSVKTVMSNFVDLFAQGSEEGDEGEGSRGLAELVKSWWNKLKSLFRRGISVAGNLPQAQGYATLLRSGTFYFVRDTLICIDDLERKGGGLAVRDIMGLVSYLKEQRNCKVALIFNQGSLDPEAGSQYSNYREKVVDIELEYLPSVKENVALVFDEQLPYFEKILGHAETLKLTNIRILQKIKRTLDDMAPLIETLAPATVDNLRSTVVLMSWAYFSRETGGPTLEFIKTLDSSEMWGSERKKRESVFQKTDREAKLSNAKRDEEERTARWHEILRSYKWQYTDDLDRLIARHVERGFADDELAAVLQTKDQEYRGGNAQSEIQKAWEKFNESFDDNADELAQGLADTIKRNVRYMGRDQINSIVNLLRTIKKDELANSLSDLFVQANNDRPEMFRTDSFFGDENALDPYLAEKFFHARGLTEKPPQIQEVVHRITENESWNQTDEQFLSSLSVDDIRVFLKAQHTTYLHSYIKALLRFGQLGNATELQKDIANKTRDALRAIAKESDLNAVRLRRYKLEE